MKILLNLSAFLFVCSTHAQVVNYRTLDKNNASARIGDEGAFFNDYSNGVAGYEIPKGSGLRTIYNGSFWIGAQDVNGQFYFSGVTYGASSMQSQLHSGPIANPSQYTSLAYTNQYLESIWMISKQEITTHIQNYTSVTYVPPTSILEWPGNGDVSLGVAAQLAPYVDVNSDGVYDPYDGDYPDIRGDEAVYVIMNDESSSNPHSLGIELHAMFYQYNAGSYMGNTTFLNVQVFNRSNKHYYNYRQTLYLDFDIGNYSDDYIGCNVQNSVAFGYNGDDNDEADSGYPGYGMNPPCQGVVSLSHDMHSFGYFTNASSSNTGDSGASDTVLWNYMNAQWADSSAWLFGGLGFQGSAGVTNTPTNFLFSGNPNDPTAWHEGSNNNAAGDRRGIMTIAQNDLPQWTSFCSDYAFIYDKSSTRLANVQNVINIAGSLRTLYNAQFEFPCNSGSFNSIDEQGLSALTIYPNPSNGTFTIDLGTTATKGNITIMNLSGRVVLNQAISDQSTVINLQEAAGVYMVFVETPEGRKVQKLIVE